MTTQTLSKAPHLTPSTKRVLDDLRENVTPEGFYVQSVASRRLGIASRTVKRALDTLHNQGVIVYVSGHTPFPSRVHFPQEKN